MLAYLLVSFRETHLHVSDSVWGSSGQVEADAFRRPHQVTNLSCMSRRLGPIDGKLAMSVADVHSFALSPLQVLSGFADFFVETSIDVTDLPTNLPFDLTSHPNAQVDVAEEFLVRTSEDIQRYNDSQNGAKTPWVKGLTAEDAASFVAAQGSQGQSFEEVQARLQLLLERLEQLQAHDEDWMMQATETVLTQLSFAEPSIAEAPDSCHEFRLSRKCKQQADPSLGFVIRAMLSTEGAEDLLAANPYIQDAPSVLKLLFAAQLYAMRVIHANRCIDQLFQLQSTLRTLETAVLSSRDTLSITHKLSQASTGLATLMHAKRFSLLEVDAETYEYDPRCVPRPVPQTESHMRLAGTSCSNTCFSTCSGSVR